MAALPSGRMSADCERSFAAEAPLPQRKALSSDQRFVLSRFVVYLTVDTVCQILFNLNNALTLA